jgi:D-aminopeptidase
LGGYSVGVLVQTNFGGVLTINGAPVGQALKKYYLKDELERTVGAMDPQNRADGSIIIVVGTDAPVDARNLGRMAARTMLGLARTGASATNGSGDYAIAFSTSPDVRIRPASPADRTTPRIVKSLPNDAISPIFQAVIEATEEAIYNSLFRATTTSGRGRTVEALPLDQTLEILRKHGLIQSRP